MIFGLFFTFSNFVIIVSIVFLLHQELDPFFKSLVTLDPDFLHFFFLLALTMIFLAFGIVKDSYSNVELITESPSYELSVIIDESFGSEAYV